MQTCVRCRGQRKLFKVGGGYSLVNMGGESVTCPLCMGSGTMKTFAEKLAKPEPTSDDDVKEKKRGRPKKIDETKVQ